MRLHFMTSHDLPFRSRLVGSEHPMDAWSGSWAVPFWLAVSMGVAMACGGCTSEQPSGGSHAVSNDGLGDSKVAERTSSGPDPQPWRFAPTFSANLPAEIHAQMLLEATRPEHARVVVLAAVLRPGQAAALSIEQWSFSQRNARDVLEPSEPSVPVLRVSPDDEKRQQLVTLRRELAAPGTTVVRPLGVQHEPKAMLTQLHADAMVVLDASASGEHRVGALARIFRATEDALILEQDAVPELVNALARGPWTLENEQVIGTRRKWISARDVHGELRSIELTRHHGGWAISTLPSPTAP